MKKYKTYLIHIRYATCKTTQTNIDENLKMIYNQLNYFYYEKQKQNF